MHSDNGKSSNNRPPEKTAVPDLPAAQDSSQETTAPVARPADPERIREVGKALPHLGGDGS